MTAFVFYKLWEFARKNLGDPLIDRIFTQEPVPTHVSVMGGAAVFLLLVLLAMLVGVMLTSFIGVRVFRTVESSLLRLPFISAVYKPIRQVTDFFVSDKAQQFRSVVAVEYPRKGMYSVGFVTSSGLRDVTTPDGRRMISVFIPSSPTPFTGYVIMVAESDVIPLPIAIDEAIRFTVSGGVIRPNNQIPDVETPKIMFDLPETDG